MKREFLEGLGLEKEVVEKIMKEHGITVQNTKPEDYDSLKEQIKTHKQVVDDLNGKLASKKDGDVEFEKERSGFLSKIADYERKDLQYRVARENNLPFDLASRLSGETEEDLIADAKSLASYLSQEPTLPLHPGDGDIKVDPYADMVDKL